MKKMNLETIKDILIIYLIQNKEMMLIQNNKIKD